MDNTCWVIAGPTASGKTALSLRLAQEYGCEIICMDSMQIYLGMDIGTAKPTPEERAAVPHHMVDVADPTEAFSVARYQEMAENCVRDIQSRGRRALFVGGTGLYLRALRHPMAMGDVSGNEEIRAEYQRVADAEGGRERLHALLEEIDPQTAKRLPLADVRRVIRALEVWRLTGLPFSQQPQREEKPAFSYRVVSLNMDRAKLYERVEKRVDLMIAQGLVDEVRGLLARGVPENAQAMKGLGYKELVPYLKGACTLEEAVYEMKLGTRHYAKRQLTWMRREEDVCWLDSLSPDCYGALEAYMTQNVETKGEEKP